MDIRQTLERLCSVGAPSGFERSAALVAKELLEPLMDEVWIDRLGNVIGLAAVRTVQCEEVTAGCPFR